MEYKEAILMNYSKIVDFENDICIEEHDSIYDTYVSFPCKPLISQNGKQFFILGILKWVLHESERTKSEVYFLIFEPSKKNIWENFYNYSKDLETGSLFVATLTNGKETKHTPLMFFKDAIEYKKKHNITPLFLSLLSHEQIIEIKNDLRKELLSYM